MVGNRPRRGAFVKNGSEYWVTNELGNSVSIIDTKKLTELKKIEFEIKGIRKTDITPVDFAISHSQELA